MIFLSASKGAVAGTSVVGEPLGYEEAARLRESWTRDHAGS